MNIMPNQNPPTILVQTWLQLLKSDMEQEFKLEVERKITSVFGSIEVAVIYLQEKSNST
ncbi:hypothetical protein [Paraglaciecola marina]|uniref:hypothetical protein n=1 Tax=Paraglaciecola marina TaxID=2500157 RepID=UPI001414FB3E|nr:hypothetical protein [Paraglaciecola marina]